jgi:hypothetical protein
VVGCSGTQSTDVQAHQLQARRVHSYIWFQGLNQEGQGHTVPSCDIRWIAMWLQGGCVGRCPRPLAAGFGCCTRGAVHFNQWQSTASHSREDTPGRSRLFSVAAAVWSCSLCWLIIWCCGKMWGVALRLQWRWLRAQSQVQHMCVRGVTLSQRVLHGTCRPVKPGMTAHDTPVRVVCRGGSHMVLTGRLRCVQGVSSGWCMSCTHPPSPSNVSCLQQPTGALLACGACRAIVWWGPGAQAQLVGARIIQHCLFLLDQASDHSVAHLPLVVHRPESCGSGPLCCPSRPGLLLLYTCVAAAGILPCAAKCAAQPESSRQPRGASRPLSFFLTCLWVVSAACYAPAWRAGQLVAPGCSNVCLGSARWPEGQGGCWGRKDLTHRSPVGCVTRMNMVAEGCWVVTGPMQQEDVPIVSCQWAAHHTTSHHITSQLPGA